MPADGGDEMITAVQIRPYKGSASAEATALLALIARLRQERDPFYLTLSEFDRIVRWKLRGQYHRTRSHRAAWTDHLVRDVTQGALDQPSLAERDEVNRRVDRLCALDGVGMGVASATLALTFPDDYATIDRFNWPLLFDEERATFTRAHYKRYLREIRRLKDELNADLTQGERPWTMQEVDVAMWHYADARRG